MAIRVLFFGQLAELTGSKELQVKEAGTTRELKATLEQQFPALKGLVFNTAVDTIIVREETALKPGSTVAFLPPFSGG
jgi:sulfur-carrier protein